MCVITIPVKGYETACAAACPVNPTDTILCIRTALDGRVQSKFRKFTQVCRGVAQPEKPIDNVQNVCKGDFGEL